MAYDPLAESLRLIADGVTEDPPRLSRRRRFAALAVDVDGDVACTSFVRRAHGGFEHVTWVLQRRGGQWQMLGGGAASSADDLLGDRPPTDRLGGPVISTGSGGVRARADRLRPWRTRWVRYAQLRLAQEVRSFTVRGRRVAVPRHGYVVVVWAARRTPVATARDAEGRALWTGPVASEDPRRMPGRYRDRG